MKPTHRAATSKPFHGVLAASVTPMKANQEIDFPRVADFTDYLVRAGLHGLVPLGSTRSRSSAERA